ncbi:MAG: hypothetical protein IH969_09305, partial [Candidatus Krumholzibacteriota bacterium]|nr:hypothetical protein [Candidatus Krumholzibacteriota bacterium]
MKNRSFKKSVLLTCIVVVASLFFGMQPALGTDELSTTTTRVQRVSVPPVMSYDGYLRDASGSPVPDGQYQFTFALFTEPEGGTAVWVEEHKNVRVRGGVFSVLLGRGTAAKPLDIPFDGSYFLGVRVGSDPEMVPRVELATAAYAFRARMADEVRDQSVTAEKLAPDLVTSILGGQWALSGSDPRSPIKGANWHITGNIGTDTTHNFIGTADSLALIFRTSNREALRITETGEIVIRGDLRVSRDLYVGRDAYIGRNLTVNPTGTPSFEVLRGGQVVITSTKTGTDNVRGNYPLLIDAEDQGIAIKTKGTADGANNYISFWDDGGMVGRIEGNTAVDQLTNPEWILLTALAAADITISIINEIAAVTSANGCVGVGAVACPPIPSWNIE